MVVNMMPTMYFKSKEILLPNNDVIFKFHEKHLSIMKTLNEEMILRHAN